MKGGVGTASITLEDGLAVAALVAVNAVGDIVDPATGRVVAGARAEDGGLADVRRLLRGEGPGGSGSGDGIGNGGAGEDSGGASPGATGVSAGGNTTIGVVATNAVLTRAQITKVAQMAHDGLARTIYPAHTPRDGDTLFGLATGTVPAGPDARADVTRIGALAAEVVAEAILRAVRNATGLPGFPAVSDLTPPP